MSQKTKLTLRFIAVMMVLLTVGMHLQWVIIPALLAYKFWLVVAGFVTLLVVSH